SKIPSVTFGVGPSLSIASKNWSYLTASGLGFASYNFKNKFGAETNFQFMSKALDWNKNLNIPEFKKHFEASLFFNFKSFIGKIRRLPIMVDTKISDFAGTQNGSMFSHEYIILKNVNAMKTYGVEFGYQYLNESVTKNVTFNNTLHFENKKSGFTLGISRTVSANLKVNTPKYGDKDGGKYNKMRLDFLYLPISSITLLEGNNTGNYVVQNSNIGYRFVFENLPVKSKEKIGFTPLHRVELGLRPIDGYYFMYTFKLAVYK
ncbi:MAG: hypothetical protein ACK5B9_11190, partial [Flavobacteriia bacterium]